MQVQLPPMQRMIRKVDELFLSQLIINMEKHPNGAYEPLFLLVKDLKSKVDFNSNEVNSYKYEVLAGTHNVLAAISLSEKYPEESMMKHCGLLPSTILQDLSGMKLHSKMRQVY